MPIPGSNAKLTLTIDCSNAAFEGEAGTLAELERIFLQISRTMRDYSPYGHEYGILDVNGNVVGKLIMPDLDEY